MKLSNCFRSALVIAITALPVAAQGRKPAIKVTPQTTDVKQMSILWFTYFPNVAQSSKNNFWVGQTVQPKTTVPLTELYEIGLRADGVLVWRYRPVDAPTPNLESKIEVDPVKVPDVVK